MSRFHQFREYPEASLLEHETWPKQGAVAAITGSPPDHAMTVPHQSLQATIRRVVEARALLIPMIARLSRGVAGLGTWSFGTTCPYRLASITRFFLKL
jgi:hypothetical protein